MIIPVISRCLRVIHNLLNLTFLQLNLTFLQQYPYFFTVFKTQKPIKPYLFTLFKLPILKLVIL